MVEKELFIENLLVQIHFVIEMIRRTGLALWHFGFPWPCWHGKRFVCVSDEWSYGQEFFTNVL